jgi:hypothetical protein
MWFRRCLAQSLGRLLTGSAFIGCSTAMLLVFALPFTPDPLPGVHKAKDIGDEHGDVEYQAEDAHEMSTRRVFD